MRNRSAAGLLAVFFAIAAEAQTGYLTYPAGVNPTGITAADLNGDGKPDLIVANTGSSSLTILLNNSLAGSPAAFAPAASVSFANAFAPRSVVAADLNGDGRTDLAVVGTNLGQAQTASGGIEILLGNGDGTFRAPLPVSGVSGATSVQIADLNGDGVPDLAATYLTLGFLVPTGAGLAVLPGNGDGTFGAASGGFLGLTPWAVLTIGDFNHDGKPDIAAVVERAVTVFLNDGKANFTPVVNGGQAWDFAPAIATGDLNGDGVLDVAVSGQPPDSPSAMVSILLGKGDGTFQVSSTVASSSTAQNILLADLNGDGHVDLLAGSGTPEFFPGMGNGSFAGGLPFGASGNAGYFTILPFAGVAAGLATTKDSQNGGSVVVLPRIVWPTLILANVAAAGFGLGPLAPGSAATALGSNLANQTASASSGTPPTSLGGDTVTVTGSDGKPLPAELYYVSAQQINYVIPAGAPQGLATVTILAGGTVAATGQIDIEPVAPALFTVNAANLAAAYITRVNQSGQQTFQPVYTVDAKGNYLPALIDLSSATDTLYLSIFGTGIRNNRAPISVFATLGSVTAQVTYAGAQGSYDGLDQVNILIPSGPSGPLANATSFSATLQLTVGGQPSNTVTLTVN